jgi:hypothetical protein
MAKNRPQYLFHRIRLLCREAVKPLGVAVEHHYAHLHRLVHVQQPVAHQASQREVQGLAFLPAQLQVDHSHPTGTTMQGHALGSFLVSRALFQPLFVFLL